MYLAQNLSYLMGKHKMKNSELAEKIGVSPTQIGHYLKGKGTPRITGLVALGELFDVNVHDLILVDIERSEPRPFDKEAASKHPDEQLKELNKLLRQRVAVLEKELKERDPELARDLGIE